MSPERVSVVINKAGMCGKGIKIRQVTTFLFPFGFLLSIGKRVKH